MDSSGQRPSHRPRSNPHEIPECAVTFRDALLPTLSFIMLASSLTAVACNISGQPCGLLNTSACDPSPVYPTCKLLGFGGSGAGAGGGDGAGGDPGTSTSDSTAMSTSAGSGAGGGDPSPSPQDVDFCMDGMELDTWFRCRGLSPTACAAQCKAIGAYCVELAAQPYSPSAGIGNLKQCKSGTPTWTCTYCYVSGDVCTFFYPGGLPLCTYTGGKGCD
jgi:hypothetical protein